MLDATAAQSGHNIIKANAWFEEQNRIILAAGEENSDHVIQLFYCHLACPVQTFLQAINELKRKWDRHENATPIELMDEAALSCNTLQIEGRWIAEDLTIKAAKQIMNEIKNLGHSASMKSNNADRKVIGVMNQSIFQSRI